MSKEHTKKINRIRTLQRRTEKLRVQERELQTDIRKSEQNVFDYCKKNGGHFNHYADAYGDGNCEWCKCPF